MVVPACPPMTSTFILLTSMPVPRDQQNTNAFTFRGEKYRTEMTITASATRAAGRYRIRLYITPAPPGPIFHGRLSPIQLEWYMCQKGRRWKTSRRELSEDVSFGIGTLLVCRVIEVGKPSKGVVIYMICPMRTAAQ